MSKITSKLQVTIPKALADRYGLRPGDEIGWEPAGGYIRLVPKRRAPLSLDRAERLRLFDEASARQREREEAEPWRRTVFGDDRGWTRDELYTRGSTD